MKKKKIYRKKCNLKIIQDNEPYKIDHPFFILLLRLLFLHIRFFIHDHLNCFKGAFFVFFIVPLILCLLFYFTSESVCLLDISVYIVYIVSMLQGRIIQFIIKKN